jgi:hypothetical protein
MPKNRIHEPARQTDVIDEVDVLVVGGGPAGVCAAVSAARAGARTILIERHGFLGGMWTAGMVLTLAGFNSWLRPYHRCVGGVAGAWVARAAALGGAEDNESWVLNSDPETMKLVADALLEQAGVKCLLHTWGAQPIMEKDRVRGLLIENKDGRRAILARVTIDCTGDGDVFARAEAPWIISQSLQPMTMPFQIGNVKPDSRIDISEPVRIPIGPEPVVLREPILSQYASRRHDVPCDIEAMRRARERGDLPNFGGPWWGGLERDVAWVNTTRVYGDASRAADLSRAEVQARKDVFALMAHFREHIPGFENARLLHTSTQIGIRETRRLVGTYVLTGDDILQGKHFSDSIAVGCWPIDVHPPQGQVGVHEMHVPLPYQIPYRVLLPQKIGGLLVAGRCASFDRQALGSVRVGATCAALGDAAGIAAAVAAHHGIEPSQVDPDEVIKSLLRQNAIVDPPTGTSRWEHMKEITK